MNKAIASGIIVDNDSVTIAATVYVELTAAGAESEEAGAHYVTLSYKKYDADDMPTAPLSYADILADASGDALVVPGLNGHEDVELDEPTAVKYAKTKAFVRNEKAQVYAAMRYNY